MNQTLLQSVQPVYDWLASTMLPWGVVGLFGLAVAESIMFVGVLVPGEVTVVGAAFVAAGGSAPIALIFALAWLGSVLGSTIGYAVGRRMGFSGIDQLIARWNGRWEAHRFERWLTVDAGFIDDTMRYFERHGILTVFAARFAVGAKGFIPPIAGAAKMRFRQFIPATLAGTFVYTAFLVFVGWFLNLNAQIAGQLMAGFGWFGALSLLALVVFAMMVIRGYAVRRRRMYLEEQGFDVHDQTTVGERLVRRIDRAAGLAEVDGEIDGEHDCENVSGTGEKPGGAQEGTAHERTAHERTGAEHDRADA